VTSLGVSAGTCTWDSGNNGGTLSVGGAITESGGTLAFGAKTINVISINVTAGALSLGTAAIAVSSAPNVINGTTSITNAGSTITLNSAGNLTLDAAHSVGSLVVAANTTLLSTHVAAAVTGFTVNNGITFSTGGNTFRTTGNVTLTGSYGEVGGSFFVGGTLTVAGSGNFASTGAGALSVTGTTANAGTIDSSGGTGTQSYTVAVTNTGTMKGGGTVTFTTTYGQSAGSLTGGAGLVTFTGVATESGGTITAGAGDLQFDAQYTGTGGTLVGLSGATLTFQGNTALGTFTPNACTVVFSGMASPQTFDSNGQALPSVTINDGAGNSLQLINNDVTQRGSLLYIQSGILDLQTNNHGWITDSGTGSPIPGNFTGVNGILRLNAGAGLNCTAFTSQVNHTVDNLGANTITVSGSVTIVGVFTNANFLPILVMNGPGNLDAYPPASPNEIGNLTVNGSTVTLNYNLDLAGSLVVGPAGVLDVSATNYPIQIAGNWTNNNGVSGFNARSGTVTVTNTSGAMSINGQSTTWWDFVCTVSTGLTISFANNPSVFTFENLFEISSSSSSSPITLTRLNMAAGNPTSPYYTFPGDNGKFWDITVQNSATLILNNVIVYYSNASTNPIIATPTLPGATVTVGYGTPYYDYKWLSGLPLVYSYTEDSDGNGKIDRIRVQANAALNDDFSGFVASVTGYTVTGYSYPSLHSSNFYINLKEQSFNDTGATPTWTITKNTSLKDQGTGLNLATLYNYPMTPTNTAFPRIAYTLALPNSNQVFVHASEPLFGAISFNSSVGSAAFTPVTTSGGGISEFLLTLSASVTAATIASGTATVTVLNAVDGGTIPFDAFTTNPELPHPTYPTALGSYAAYDISIALGGTGIVPPYPTPNAAAATHRLSDVLVDVPIAKASDPTYFLWPVYAKDSNTVTLSDSAIAALTPAQTASEGIGLIRAFDGSQWLQAQNITVQARMQPTLTGVSGATLWFDSNVPATLTSPYGLWLPAFAQTGFSGLVPFPDASPWAKGAISSIGAGVGTNLYNFSIPGNDLVSLTMLGFFFTIQPNPPGQPLYVVRLNLPAGAAAGVVPPDSPAWHWYRNLMPFSFQVHNIVSQKGGVTILNNVIDPTKGETTRLAYQLPNSGTVTVTVFTLDGDVVARLVNGQQAAGSYSVDWNGRNMAGNAVARGLYFVRIVASGVDEIRKVLVVRHQ